MQEQSRQAEHIAQSRTTSNAEMPGGNNAISEETHLHISLLFEAHENEVLFSGYHLELWKLYWKLYVEIVCERCQN